MSEKQSFMDKVKSSFKLNNRKNEKILRALYRAGRRKAIQEHGNHTNYTSSSSVSSNDDEKSRSGTNTYGAGTHSRSNIARATGIGAGNDAVGTDAAYSHHKYQEAHTENERSELVAGTADSHKRTDSGEYQSSKGHYVSLPPRVARKPLEQDYGGDYANAKNPTELAATGKSGLVDNTHPHYYNDATTVKGQGKFYDPQDTQGGAYGRHKHGEGAHHGKAVGGGAINTDAETTLPGGVGLGDSGPHAEATQAELPQERNLKTKPSAYYEQDRIDAENEVLEDAYNQGKKQAELDRNLSSKPGGSKNQAGFGYVTNADGSSRSDSNSEEAHFNNKSTFNEGGLDRAIDEARGTTTTTAPGSKASDSGTGRSPAAGAAGGGAVAAIGTGSSQPSASYGLHAGSNLVHTGHPPSSKDFDYNREIKRLDDNINNTQRKIDQHGISSGNSGVATDVHGKTLDSKIDLTDYPGESNQGILGSAAAALGFGSAEAYAAHRVVDHETTAPKEGSSEDASTASLYHQPGVISTNTGSAATTHDVKHEAYEAGVKKSAFDSGFQQGDYDSGVNRGTSNTTGAHTARSNTTQTDNFDESPGGFTDGAAVADGAAARTDVSRSGTHSGSHVGSSRDKSHPADELKTDVNNVGKVGGSNGLTGADASTMPFGCTSGSHHMSSDEELGAVANQSSHNKETGAAVGLTKSREKSKDGTNSQNSRSDSARSTDPGLGAMVGSTGHISTGNKTSFTSASNSKQEQAIDSAHSRKLQQGVSDSSGCDHDKSAPAAAIGASVEDASYHDKPTGTDKYHDSSSLSDSSGSSSSSHKNVTYPIVEVIGIKERSEAEKLAQKTTAKLVAEGVELNHGKIIVNTKTNEVYRVPDTLNASTLEKSESLGHINDFPGSSTLGSSNTNNLRLLDSQYGADGARAASAISHHGQHSGQHSRQPQHVDAAYNDPVKDVDPRKYYKQHQEAKEQLELAADEGELANIPGESSQQLIGPEADRLQDHGISKVASATAIESSSGIGSNEANYGAGRAGILDSTVAALGFSHHNKHYEHADQIQHDRQPQHVDAAFNEPVMEVDPQKYHRQHEIAKKELEEAADEGKLANIPGENQVSNYTGQAGGPTGFVGSSGATCLGASSSLGSVHDHLHSTHSPPSQKSQDYSLVSVLGVSNTEQARELANAAVLQLQGRPEVLSSSKELKVDAKTGAVTNGKGQFMTQLGGYNESHLSPNPDVAGGIVTPRASQTGAGTGNFETAFGSTSGTVSGTDAPSHIDSSWNTSSKVTSNSRARDIKDAVPRSLQGQTATVENTSKFTDHRRSSESIGEDTSDKMPGSFF